MNLIDQLRFVLCSHRRMQHSDFPPAIWEKEEMARRENPRKESTASSVSTFEEVESLNHSQSLSNTDSGSISGSIGAGYPYPPREYSGDSTEGKFGGRGPRGSWHTQKQPSFQSDQSSLSTTSHSISHASETFEEVESLDFGGHHDLEQDLHLTGFGGLSYHDLQQFDKLQGEKVRFRNKFDSDHHRGREQGSDSQSTKSGSTQDSSSSGKEVKRKTSTRQRGRDLIVPEGEEELPIAKTRHKAGSQEGGHGDPRARRPSDFYSPGHKTIFDQLMEYKVKRTIIFNCKKNGKYIKINFAQKITNHFH